MPKPRRTPEEVCIAYAVITAEIRAMSETIKPWDCERCASPEFQPGWPGNTTPIDPCLTALFQKRDSNESQSSYEDAQFEIEDSMCDRCAASLKAIRDRRKLRVRLGAAKRAVAAVGKRLNAEVKP